MATKVKFKKKSGGTFVKTFKSQSAAKRAVAGWKSAGGKVAKNTKSHSRHYGH